MLAGVARHFSHRILEVVSPGIVSYNPYSTYSLTES
jgi:hypothetical protein